MPIVSDILCCYRLLSCQILSQIMHTWKNLEAWWSVVNISESMFWFLPMKQDECFSVVLVVFVFPAFKNKKHDCVFPPG